MKSMLHYISVFRCVENETMVSVSEHKSLLLLSPPEEIVDLTQNGDKMISTDVCCVIINNSMCMIYKII
jgi:hypothetical protein